MFSANTLLEQERIKKSISMRKLTKGICSHQLLIKATNSDTNIELLTFEILLERVGRSPEYLEYVLSEKEYNDILTRDKIDDLIHNRDYSSAEELLLQYIPEIDSANSTLKMYFYRIKAWLYVETCDYSSAKDYILKAIYTTLPGITLSNYKEYLFSLYEYENILMLCNILFLSGKKQSAASMIETLYMHAVSSISDQWLLVSILPKCAYLLSTFAQDQLASEAIINYCEEAIDLMRNEGTLYMMSPLLTNLIDLYRKNGTSDRVSYWTPYKDAINDILSKYASELPQNSVYFHWKRASYNLDTEIIHAERLRLNLSQEDLAEGVFSASCSVSYLETKKHAPNKNSYNKLMNRVGIDKPKRSSFILTESFDRLDLFLEFKNAATKLDYNHILSLIEKNKPFLPHEEKMVSSYKYLAINALNLLDSSSVSLVDSDYDTLDKFLDKCISSDRKPFLEDIYAFTSCLLSENKTDPTLLSEAFINILKAHENSRILPIHTYNSYATTCINYISSLGKNLSAKTVNDTINSCIMLSILTGNGHPLSEIFWAKTRAFHKRYAHDYETLYYAYIFASLYKKATTEYIKSFLDYYYPEHDK